MFKYRNKESGDEGYKRMLYSYAVAEIEILNGGGASAVNFPSLGLEVFKSTLK